MQAIMKHQSPIMLAMGTGVGKTLLFPLPAKRISSRTTVVISPLVLLQDHMVRDVSKKQGIRECVIRQWSDDIEFMSQAQKRTWVAAQVRQKRRQTWVEVREVREYLRRGMRLYSRHLRRTGIDDQTSVCRWFGQRVEWGGIEAMRLVQAFHKLGRLHRRNHADRG